MEIYFLFLDILFRDQNYELFFGDYFNFLKHYLKTLDKKKFKELKGKSIYFGLRKILFTTIHLRGIRKMNLFFQMQK